MAAAEDLSFPCRLQVPSGHFVAISSDSNVFMKKQLFDLEIVFSDSNQMYNFTEEIERY